MDTLLLLQWIGCAFGVAGAASFAQSLHPRHTLAERNKWSGVAAILFLISNGFWVAFALISETHGLFWQQIAFTATSLMGIRNWLNQSSPD